MKKFHDKIPPTFLLQTELQNLITLMQKRLRDFVPSQGLVCETDIPEDLHNCCISATQF